MIVIVEVRRKMELFKKNITKEPEIWLEIPKLSIGEVLSDFSALFYRLDLLGERLRIYFWLL